MFKSGVPVYGDEFIDRKEHIKKFNTYIKNNQHITIKAPRRYGKTSLIVHIFKLYDYPTIYIDLQRATSLKSLAENIIDEAYNLAGIENIIYKAKESISSLFKYVKTKLKVDLEIFELTIETLEKNQKNQIKDIELFLYSLNLVEEIAKKQNINIKFAFDEFQDILTLADKSILKQTRSILQHHQHVTYIFLGSIESIMNSIFSDKKSPFFHFSRIIELDGLDIDELINFCNNFFKEKNIKTTPFLDDILRFLEGHPYYSMKTLQSIYFFALENNNQIIDKEDYINALKNAFFETKSYLEEVIENLKQKKYHYSVLWHLANDSKDLSLNSSTLYKTLKSLEDMGYVRKLARGEYKITDKFLEILLQQDNKMVFENKLKLKGL